MDNTDNSSVTEENPSENEVNADSERHQKLLDEAKRRFDICVEAESKTRQEELEDEKFFNGEQWPSQIKADRSRDERPCLTINRLPQFVRQITNDQRQNRPSIKVNPVDNEATVETAKVFQGMIRHIEYNSHADIAYDTAFEACAKTGIGYYRVTSEYADPWSFRQELVIKQIKDRFSTYLDPLRQEPDGSDSQYGFISEKMSKAEYGATYPKSKLTYMSDWQSLGTRDATWFQEDACLVSEYYYIHYEEVEIVKLSDGTVLEKTDLPKEFEAGVRIVSERKTVVPRVKWAKINGIEVLDETDIPVPWIPIIPVIGEEQSQDGIRVYAGIVRNAKDPQRMYNYMVSAETETIALAPKAPWIIAEGQIEGYEKIWQTANTENHQVLPYQPMSLEGVQVPPPQRNVQEPPIQAIATAVAQKVEELKATTGIYDATLGNRSNEQSGVAIQRRNAQSQTSNFHFIDNLSRSLRHTGRILLAWIPQVYSESEVVRTIGEDGQVKMVTINDIFKEAGTSKHHFLDAGRYDVTVDTGPSYQTKRQEAVAGMLDLARTAPQAMQNCLDLFVKAMDFPFAQEIADRLRLMLPPNLLANNPDQPPVPPQVQAQLQQQGALINTLTKELNANTAIIEKKSLELASAERIAMIKAQTDLVTEVMKHDQKDAMTVFQAEMDRINRRMDQDLNYNQPINPNQMNQNQATGQQPVGPVPNQQPTGGSSPGQSMGGNNP